jgi:antagonist of KipI
MTPNTARDPDRFAEIVPAGDAAMLVRFGTAISAGAHARVMALLRALDSRPLDGLRDLVPAYASLLVLFDSLATSHAAVASHLRAALNRLRVRNALEHSRVVHIPVGYGGAAGPDLDEVARLVGLAPEEVIRRHAGAEYRVAFLGFLAGFPYLTGLPSELAVPRLASPRTQVPAGSVALAGQQTGIYPVVAPGGWRIIGRTTARLFDPGQDPPALLRPGDRVRFEPVPAGEVHDPPTDAGMRGGETAGAATAPQPDALPWLTVRVPGPLTTVQDLGRAGYARYGVSASGAADADALRLGNLLLGNPPSAAALEVTLGGATLDVLAPCAVAVTGASGPILRNGTSVSAGVVVALQAGDTLQLGWARHGARYYLCVAGGAHTAPVLGSRATDLRAGLGGVDGRALRAGDVLWRGPSALPADMLAGRRLPLDPLRSPGIPATRPLRVLAGQHAADVPADLDALLAGTYLVSPQSDRVGVRLQPAGGAHLTGGETISEGMPRGAVQVPPSGEPVILLADHQTTGGYRVPAVVATVDLWRVAQLRPGDALRFALVAPDEAVAALRERTAWLDWLAARAVQSMTSSAGYQPDEALLMRGFAEWSDEEEHDDE